MIDEQGISSGYVLLNLSSAVDLFRSATFVVDVFTYVFVTMISLIAVANVFNTISTNIRLRRRELAMLRSVGMSDRDFNKMMYFECAFYGMRTLMWGIPISGLISWLIYKGMTTVHFHGVPWQSAYWGYFLLFSLRLCMLRERLGRRILWMRLGMI